MFTTAINFVISILFQTLLSGKNEKELFQVIFFFISLTRISLCDHGLTMIHGQVMVKLWSSHGQVMVRSWSDHGQVIVRSWSSHGRIMVRPWSVLTMVWVDHGH